MVTPHPITVQTSPFITAGDHANSKYFEAIKILVAEREKAVAAERPQWQEAIDEVYALVADEIRNHAAQPSQAIFGGPPAESNPTAVRNSASGKLGGPK